MRNLSIRVPDELEERLDREARNTGKRRSELAREALDTFLDESEKRRFMRQIAAAARELRGDPEIRAVQEDFAAAADAEALEIAEGPTPDDGERWWR